MKQTEIAGVEDTRIPDDWEVKKLGEISNGFSYGVGAEAVSFNGSDRYIRITDIDDVTNRFSPNPLCSPKFYSSSDIVQENDILFARTGASVGKTYIYDKKDGRLIFAGFLMKLHVKDADSRFIFYQTLTDKYKAWVISESMRTGQPGLNLEQIKNFSIPLPPLAEQQRIAKTLSDVDALISTTEKLIQKKKNIKQGAMQNLLTGKKRLPGFGPQTQSPTYKQTELGPIPEDWEVKSLGEISTIIMGQSPNSDCYNTQKGMVLIQGNADISNRKTICRFYTTHITKTARKGDVIFTVRAPVGNVAKATFDCCLGRGVCAIQRISDFLYYYLIFIEDSWSKTSTGSTFDSINSDTLASTLIIQPSSKEEQTAIANVLSSMDKEIETLNTKLEKYRNLKTAIMQQLLTGKIRLIGERDENKRSIV